MRKLFFHCILQNNGACHWHNTKRPRAALHWGLTRFLHERLICFGRRTLKINPWIRIFSLATFSFPLYNTWIIIFTQEPKIVLSICTIRSPFCNFTSSKFNSMRIYWQEESSKSPFFRLFSCFHCKIRLLVC